MHASEHGAIGPDPLEPSWGPRLVRFYYFICADKAAAEASAIDTIAEAVRQRMGNSSLASVARLIVARSQRLRCGNPNGDPVSQAMAFLTRPQRLAVALSRCLGLTPQETAAAMGVHSKEAKRLLADGLLELHRRLKGPEGKLENSSEI